MDVRSRESIDVIELQPARFRASAPVHGDEFAMPRGALVDGPLDGIGNVPQPPGRGCRNSIGARFSPDRKSLLLQFDDQSIERVLEHRGQLAAGNTVPEEILRLAKLVSERARCRELYLEGVRGQ